MAGGSGFAHLHYLRQDLSRARNLSARRADCLDCVTGQAEGPEESIQTGPLAGQSEPTLIVADLAAAGCGALRSLLCRLGLRFFRFVLESFTISATL